ncbi:MAG: hypothetical protein K0R17_2982 [Rariglobus sp.]|jgi:hypothetical protein|nr:hypothetical protein [Rariglobus sp.]
MKNELHSTDGAGRESGEGLAGDHSTNPSLTRRATAEPKASGVTLWMGVGVIFALMGLAWTAMFFFASKYRAADVPPPAREAAR